MVEDTDMVMVVMRNTTVQLICAVELLSDEGRAVYEAGAERASLGEDHRRMWKQICEYVGDGNDWCLI